MDAELLKNLSRITDEEQAILDGEAVIDRGIYMRGASNVVSSDMVLEDGTLIAVRPHTRFTPFPAHTHDYVEMVYMYSGEIVHTVNDQQLKLKQGALLLLNQSAVHQVARAREGDVAVNFIVQPEYFTELLTMIGGEYTPLRKFLVDCLCEQDSGAGYLLFDTSQIKAVQNLMDNLLWILLQDTPNKLKMSRMTMALIFLELMRHTDALLVDDWESSVVFRVLQHVEVHYANTNFAQLAQKLRYEPSWLSREIKRKTGKTYTQLVQEKRLAQAALLLRNTQRNISQIAAAVGYENTSYFHRIFKEVYGKSPRSYRQLNRPYFKKA